MYMYTCSCTILDFSQIIMPSKVWRRDQLIGSDRTVIGLTKKRKCQANKPVPFLVKNFSIERERCVYLSLCLFLVSTLHIAILSWFVDVEVPNSAVASDKIVEDNDIEVRPEKIYVSCLDENACLKVVGSIVL